MTTLYIIYVPSNMQSEAEATIRGIYTSFEEAKQKAQEIVDIETFEYWISLQSCKYEEYRKLTYKYVMHIMKVLMNTEINQDMDYIDFVEASYEHPLIQNHEKFNNYKKDYDLCKINNKYH